MTDHMVLTKIAVLSNRRSHTSSLPTLALVTALYLALATGAFAAPSGSHLSHSPNTTLTTISACADVAQLLAQVKAEAPDSGLKGFCLNPRQYTALIVGGSRWT